MPVICADCQTENRDAAKFCHGCARKLPGFAATGPSLLDGLGSKRAPGAAAGHRFGAAAQNAPREFWLGLGAVMLAVAVGFGGWFGYVTRKVPAPASRRGAAGRRAAGTAAAGRGASAAGAGAARLVARRRRSRSDREAARAAIRGRRCASAATGPTGGGRTPADAGAGPRRTRTRGRA